MTQHSSDQYGQHGQPQRHSSAHLEQRLDEWTRRTLEEISHPSPAEILRRQASWRRFWDGQYARIGAQLDAEHSENAEASSSDTPSADGD